MADDRKLDYDRYILAPTHEEQPPDDEEEDDDYCVRDDSTECDCSRCTGQKLGWEHDQGWHHDEDSGEPSPEDGCPGCDSERARG